MLPYVPSTSYKTYQAPNQKGEQKCSEGFLFTRLWLTIIEYKKWCNEDSFKLWWVMLIRANSHSGHFVSIFLPSGFLRSGFAFSSLPCGLQLVASFQVLQHFGRRRSHFSFLSSDTQSVPSPQSPTQQTDDTDVNISSFVGFSNNFFQSSLGLTNSEP